MDEKEKPKEDMDDIFCVAADCRNCKSNCWRRK